MPKAKSHRPKARSQPKPIATAEFDARFERGEDITAHLDLSTLRVRPSLLTEEADHAPQPVNVDFPAWVVSRLDQEADRIGIPRQSLIKVWIVERLESAPTPRD